MFKKHRRFLFFIGLVLPLSFVLICNSILITLTGGNSRSSNWEGNAMSILRVAENELGTVGGSKYREWYIGAADGAEWCATFVSWCANEVGLLALSPTGSWLSVLTAPSPAISFFLIGIQKIVMARIMWGLYGQLVVMKLLQ